MSLAEQQERLLRALLAGEDAPEFDQRLLATQAAALRGKRGRVVAKLAPDLAQLLGDRFRELFAGYADGNPRRTGESARQDAEAFRAWLIAEGHLDRPRWWRRRHI
ncbi:hypothetical protein D5S17_03975 [Pseudonocardiaceae bacterium YIM PH 21723]|nr:hypothetical protein D5S17_03975 [Pseudonocardiaceae bacterium YIM PH 21723]